MAELLKSLHLRQTGLVSPPTGPTTIHAMSFEQAVPHAPQLLRSRRRFTHFPLHDVRWSSHATTGAAVFGAFAVLALGVGGAGGGGAVVTGGDGVVAEVGVGVGTAMTCVVGPSRCDFTNRKNANATPPSKMTAPITSPKIIAATLERRLTVPVPV